MKALSLRYARSAGVALIALTVVAPSIASAQAWTRDAGSVYASLSHRYLATDQIYQPDGETSDLPTTYRQHVVSFYGEVGIVDRWLTLSLDGELFRRNVLDEQGATTGLGDMRVGLWSGLLTEPLHLSFGVVVGLPTGDPEPDAGAGADAGAQAIAGVLPTGDGETDVEFRAAAGESFGGGSWPLLHYWQVAVGYWLRTKGFADALTYRAELGARPNRVGWERLSLAFRVVGVESFEEAGGFGSAGGLGSGVSYTSWAAELGVRLVDELRIEVGYESAFRAEAIAAGGVLKFALSWQM